ncbi:MAG: hypothetical protein ACRCX2_38930 [Paraclostridium sp.]
MKKEIEIKILTKAILGTLKKVLAKEYSENRKNLNMSHGIIKSRGILLGDWIFAVTLNSGNHSIIPSIININTMDAKTKARALQDPNLIRKFSTIEEQHLKVIASMDSESMLTRPDITRVQPMYDDALKTLAKNLNGVDPLMLQVVGGESYAVDVTDDMSIVLVPFYDRNTNNLSMGVNLGVEICRSIKQDNLF